MSQSDTPMQRVRSCIELTIGRWLGVHCCNNMEHGLCQGDAHTSTPPVGTASTGRHKHKTNGHSTSTNNVGTY